MAGLWPDTPILPSVDAAAVAGLLDRCPKAAETDLMRVPDLAVAAGVAEIHLKDERGRLGLGSFKALGAAYVIARHAAEAGGDPVMALTGRTYVAASAGNHGLSLAAGARIFGARAVIVLSDTVPEAFAARLRAKGADVVRKGTIYEDSMAAAAEMAEANGWTLLSDSSWEGYVEHPYRVMEGYLQLAAEAVAQIGEPPTHVLLQAGVGGMAAAVAAYLRHRWGDGPKIVVVEPEAAPALIESVRAGRLVETEGPVSNMGRLDCKAPSLIALAGLARDADLFVTISDGLAAAAVERLAALGLATTPSGAAGVAALFAPEEIRQAMALSDTSRILAVLSEGPA
ncbi:MAG: pyridoxal-phosphate dependent enzyme [Rhodobacter sp.]|nr:pyridoxal-phosphate dependent enzyme [Rhodobacter sp.]